MKHEKTPVPKELIAILDGKGFRRSFIAVFCGITQGTITKLAKGVTHSIADSAKYDKLARLCEDSKNITDCQFKDGKICGTVIDRAFLQRAYDAMITSGSFNENHVVVKIIAEYPALAAKRANVLPWAKKFIVKIEKMGLIKRCGAMLVSD